MKKWLLRIGVVALFVLVAGGLLVLLYVGSMEKSPPDEQISVIMYDTESTGRWSSLEMGVRQACIEMEVEGPAIDAVPHMTGAQQQELAAREVAAGADGLLVAAQASDEMAKALEQQAGVPVVFVKNAPDGMDYVGADDAGMGRMLAQAIAGEEGRIALVARNMERMSVQARYEAFTSEMARQGREVSVVTPQAGRTLKEAMMAELTLRLSPAGLLVALDTATLEMLVDLVEELKSDVQVFGIGSSDRVVHALDQGKIAGMVFQDEYAIGYLAAMRLFVRLGLKGATDSDAAVQYAYVQRETMFSPEMERMLFPLVR